MRRWMLIVAGMLALLLGLWLAAAGAFAPAEPVEGATPSAVAYAPIVSKGAPATLTPTPAPTLTSTPTPQILAVIGDYGVDTADEAAVATLVASWAPEAVLTVGDNNYPNGEAATIDQNIGKYYHAFIAPYAGAYGPGAASNAFFPALGNHDWNTPGAAPYFDFFTLPGNERYYSVRLGAVEAFIVDSDPHEPDGNTAASVQGQWLQSALGQSSACWKLVLFHHAAYSSSLHGSSTWMQWPFAAWGADAVFGGHDHSYEHVSVDGIPYFVNGLGGQTIYAFNDPLPETVLRYNALHGAQRLTVADNTLTLDFIAVDGTLVESVPLTKQCP